MKEMKLRLDLYSITSHDSHISYAATSRTSVVQGAVASPIRHTGSRPFKTLTDVLSGT